MCAQSLIAKQVREFDFPDRKVVNDSYVHDLEKLLNVSGLMPEYRFYKKLDDSKRLVRSKPVQFQDR